MQKKHGGKYGTTLLYEIVEISNINKVYSTDGFRLFFLPIPIHRGDFKLRLNSATLKNQLSVLQQDPRWQLNSQLSQLQRL